MGQVFYAQEEGWQELFESRGSRTVLRGTGGEILPVYPTQRQAQAHKGVIER